MHKNAMIHKPAGGYCKYRIIYFGR